MALSRELAQVPHSAQTVGAIDLDAMLAQIEADVAERATVMAALDDLIREKQTPPLLLEMKALEYFIADDPGRID